MIFAPGLQHNFSYYQYYVIMAMNFVEALKADSNNHHPWEKTDTDLQVTISTWIYTTAWKKCFLIH